MSEENESGEVWESGEHSLYLSAHRQREQNEEVDDENRPVDRDVERLRERAEQCNKRRTGRRQPTENHHIIRQTRGCRHAQWTHQNCHSGSLRTKGRNSSSRCEGSSGPISSVPPSSSSASRSSCREGSNLGCRKARRRLRRYIACASANRVRCANDRTWGNGTHNRLICEEWCAYSDAWYKISEKDSD